MRSFFYTETLEKAYKTHVLQHLFLCRTYSAVQYAFADVLENSVNVKEIRCKTKKR